MADPDSNLDLSGFKRHIAPLYRKDFCIFF